MPDVNTVGLWHFNEGSRSTAFDTSATGNHGTITGSTWTSGGKFGKALSFDGADDGVQISAMSTAQDTLDSDGVLIYVNLVTSDIRHPDSTALELVHVLFNDGDPPAITQDGSLKLVGADGTVDTAPDSIIPRQTITITVNDIDEDRNVSFVDSFQVMAIEKVYGDSQAVWVVETGVSTGAFTSTIPTHFEASGRALLDGKLGVIAGDTVFVSYTESRFPSPGARCRENGG